MGAGWKTHLVKVKIRWRVDFSTETVWSRTQQFPLLLGEVYSHVIKGYLLLKCHPHVC